MGQKVSPIGLRVGINKPWDSTWYASKEDFAKFLLEDNKIRKFLNKEYAQASISKIEIERKVEMPKQHVFKPADIVDNAPQKTIEKNDRVIRRNDPCPCGSGKKYKNCCGKDKN